MNILVLQNTALEMLQDYYVAKWNGSSWSELGTGATALNANKDIYAVTTDASGNIYAGGCFTNNDGKKYVVKWDGISRSELGSKGDVLYVTNPYAYEIDGDKVGNVYVSGDAGSNGQGIVRFIKH